MKPTTWREMETDDLEQKVKDLTEELFNLRLQLAMGVAKNPARVGQARRDLARAKTVLRERELNIGRSR
ncbi:MAG: 50S ribosomal protein L29 [Candidatus Rokuibacteriota bacterium]|jgi:large subunit ribosomal protein L29|nr:MAG: 50S ribosomal protein L29 [Candidatus Rokubacteria bacterium]